MEAQAITSTLVKAHIARFSTVYTDDSLHRMNLQEKIGQFYDLLGRFNQVISANLVHDAALPTTLDVDHEFSYDKSVRVGVAEVIQDGQQKVKQIFRISLTDGKLHKVQDDQTIEVRTNAEEGDGAGIARNIKDKVYTELIKQISTVFEVYVQALNPVAERLEAEEKEAARPKKKVLEKPIIEQRVEEEIRVVEHPAETKRVWVEPTIVTVPVPARKVTHWIPDQWESRSVPVGKELTLAGKIGIVASIVFAAAAFTAFGLVVHHLATGEAIMMGDYDITTIEELFNEGTAIGFGAAGTLAIVALWASVRFGKRIIWKQQQVKISEGYYETHTIPASTKDVPNGKGYFKKVVTKDAWTERSVIPAYTKRVEGTPYWTVEVNGQRVRHDERVHGPIAGIQTN
jgi:hypothetical protein